MHEEARNRLLARAIARETDESETAALSDGAWEHQVDMQEAPCFSRADALLKLRSLTNPNFGAACFGDFTISDGAAVASVIAWLERA